MKKRKTKYVAWLHNKTDNRDDDWVVMWAYSPIEVMQNVDYDRFRFTLGKVRTAKQFREEEGITAKSPL